ncbi:ferric reductase-like transmembrane domain-containing protein [Ancylobacter sp. SL191]|uniref:ferredoxin reductase family protein n=1 Tax=Ancylobacter sp. SL191 TaxID=2995166 RepID=UPI00226FDA93|nr:ferric reductase-like transmembrane domain-containing protein [Ancylobacter sp. SL191]WAC28456.1 ferric reductase-like transmembrane domain-containing protein [Ancylobacter sp. SL191]
MRHIKLTLFGIIALMSVLWIAAEPGVFQPNGFFALRSAAVQYTGVLAIAAMSVAMMLALRPRWPERWMGGLDKMYRLHKWLGVTVLVVAVIHWLWAKGPKWAGNWGLLERPARAPRAPISDPTEAFFASLRGTAESVGEWAFYAAVVLIALALIRVVPYRWFYKTHRLVAIAYLLLVFHTVILLNFADWLTPLGAAMTLLMAGGTFAAGVVLLRQVGAARQVSGRIAELTYYPGVKALETIIDMSAGWPGHRAGQFAFAMSDASEGAHPYTIASDWHPDHPRITFITKELGDHTNRLKERLKMGQEVRVEGPYGCFTFDDDCRHQIWIGGGIGITPFIARMKHMAMRDGTPDWPPGQSINLFHATGDVDELALARLSEDASSANVRLHLLVSARDGRLTGARIRDAVADWREASLWFCGPADFGAALRRDFAREGFPVQKRFHQELFDMR